MIPCHNCLILPICKYKEEIKCSKLYGWMEDRNSAEIAEDILRHLPDWLTITIEEPSHGMATDLMFRYKAAVNYKTINHWR